MYKKVLVPLDGSQLAEIVLPYAARLATQFGLNVTFLHVCDASESTSFFMCESYVKHVAESAQKELAAGGEDSVTGKAVAGNVAEEILRCADETGSDLILMAAHGHSGRGLWVLGSVAHKVLTVSRVPVLLVRANLPRGKTYSEWPETVIVPLDGSTLSELVLPYVEALASKKGGAPEIRLLRVCEPPVLLADYPEAVMPENWDEHVQLAWQSAERACGLYLGEVQKRLQDAGITVHTEVLLGDKVADAVIQHAKSQPLAVIAMSTHGQSGFTKWPYGHVADRILLATENPLLLVRPGERK